MEGGVMQARAYRSLEPFDASVRRLRLSREPPRAGVSRRQAHHPTSQEIIMMFALILSVFVAQPAAPVLVTKITTPEKALRLEVVVPGSLDEVWSEPGTTTSRRSAFSSIFRDRHGALEHDR